MLMFPLAARSNVDFMLVEVNRNSEEEEEGNKQKKNHFRIRKQIY